jgi:transcriptional regulator with GAF, ATPase, and Fis domain
MTMDLCDTPGCQSPATEERTIEGVVFHLCTGCAGQIDQEANEAPAPPRKLGRGRRARVDVSTEHLLAAFARNRGYAAPTARETGLSVSTVLHRVRQLGLPTKGRGRRWDGTLTPHQEEIARVVANCDGSQAKAARRLDVTPQAVSDLPPW